MSAGILIDGRVSVQQCKRAVDSLLSHATKHEEEKAESQLLQGKEQNVWLVVNTKVMHPEKKIKPARISVKYPIVDPRTTPVCLIVKDPQREYKDLIANQGIKFISRVVDIRHLKGKWKPYEARRMLLKENGLFLADERVVPLLPSLLGRIFFQAKKQPIPVCMTRKDLKAELERAISSTYFHQNQGTCTSVKIGTVSQEPAQVLANLQTALPEVVTYVKGGWDNIQSFFIKTNSSAALPVWQCDLGADSGGRWEGLMAGQSESEDEDVEMAGESGKEDEAKKPVVDVKGKGKKRAAEETVSEKEKPKKRTKASEAASVQTEKLKKAKAPVEEAPLPTKAKTASAVVVAPPAEPTPATSEPAKKKRRKSETEPALAPSPVPLVPSQPAVETPSHGAPEKEKRKRGKSQSQAASISQEPAANEPAPAPSAAPVASAPASDSATPAKKERRKNARASLAAAADSSSAANTTPAAPAPTESAIPTTPSISKKKQRASAADFFDGAAATPAAASAAPPNTPADGLVGETPAKRKKRTKGAPVVDTPVTSAIAKLASQPADAAISTTEETSGALETPSRKKPKRKQQKADEAAVGASGVEAVPSPVVVADGAEGAAPEKKKKRKHKEKEEGAAVVAAPTLSVEEMKQKRSAAGVEKKKGKVVGAKPATKSAKDALVGKRSKKL